jgi:hypothetical protein
VGFEQITVFDAFRAHRHLALQTKRLRGAGDFGKRLHPTIFRRNVKISREPLARDDMGVDGRALLAEQRVPSRLIRVIVRVEEGAYFGTLEACFDSAGRFCRAAVDEHDAIITREGDHIAWCTGDERYALG